MKRMISALLAILLCLSAANGAAEGLLDFFAGLFSSDRVYTVGTDVAFEAITDFYYTYATSTNPPEYQRYRFYVQAGERCFYHETREGDHWPLTEADATVSGTRALTEAEWAAFCDCLSGGAVRGRQETAESGDSGPWLYLYWDGDKGDIQEYTFADLEARAAFEAMCEQLSGAA